MKLQTKNYPVIRNVHIFRVSVHPKFQRVDSSSDGLGAAALLGGRGGTQVPQLLSAVCSEGQHHVPLPASQDQDQAQVLSTLREPTFGGMISLQSSLTISIVILR